MWASRQPVKTIIVKAFIFLLMAAVLYVGTSKNILLPLTGAIDESVSPLASALTSLQNVITLPAVSINNPRIQNSQQVLLEKTTNDLKLASIKIASLESENQVLRQKLGLSPATKPQLQSGQVLSIGDSIIVQTDSNVAIANGTLVTIDNNVVGVVSAKRSDKIYAVLPTVNPNYKAKVRVLHQGISADGIVQGQFSSYMQLTGVLSTAVIDNGDYVLLNDETMPSAGPYIIGKINRVEKDETQVFRQAQVLPLFDLKSQRTVFFETK